MLGPNPNDDPLRLQPLWQAIDAFLDSTEVRKRNITELYDILKQPPYGVKDGLLPIYMALALIVWRDEIAVYEENRFVPEMLIAAYERLISRPERFTLQRFAINDARK